jgi:hypothetical protein
MHTVPPSQTPHPPPVGITFEASYFITFSYSQLMRSFFYSLTTFFRAGAVLVGLLAAPTLLFAQTPAWQRAVVVNQASGAISGAVQTATDASGNVYVTGTLAGSVTFGATTLTATGLTDLFVAKWSSATNQFVWAVQQGNGSVTYPVAIFQQGTSLYVGASGASTEVARIYKFTDAGTSASLTWNQALSYCDLLGLTASGGNIYMSGSFTSATLSVGSFTLANNTPNSADVFVAKLVDAGTTSSYAWAVRAGGSAPESGGPLAVQGNALYLMGTYYGTAAAPSIFGTTSLVSAGASDAYVAKLTDAGTSAQFTWVKRMGGADPEQIGALAVAGASVYATGQFNSASADFGTTTLTTAGGTDAFVTKLTDAGATADFTWTQRLGGAATDYASGLAVQGASVYVGGFSTSPSLVLGATTLTNAGQEDGFLATLTDAGLTSSFTSARAIATSNSDAVSGISVNGPNVYVSGTIGQGTVSLGPVTLANPTATNAAYFASFTSTALATTPSTLDGSSLYPNPAAARTSLRLPAMPGAGTATLSLYDGLGRIAKKLTVEVPATGLVQEIELGSLMSGIYLLHVQAGTASARHRLVVE